MVCACPELSWKVVTNMSYLDIPTCAELVSRIEREAEETIKKASSLIIDGDSTPLSSSGTVEKNTNNPGAEIWGVGKSKL